MAEPVRTVALRALAVAVSFAAPLALAPPAWAHAAAAKPAGGAALEDVVAATLGALVLTAALLALGLAHRSGRVAFLRRAAERVGRISGLPPWAALPGDIAALSLLLAGFGMYWDISLHIDQGRDPGPLANPAHYFILAGLFGVFAAGFLAVVLPQGRPSRSAVRIASDWWAPVGGVVLLACGAFALAAFPLDDVWHRMFGQDVTLWGPTHVMMFGGAGLALLGNAALLVEGARSRDGERRSPRQGRVLAFLARTRYAAVIGGLLVGLSTFQGEFDFGVPQFQLIFHPVLIALAAGIACVTARIYAGRGGALAAVTYFLLIRGAWSLLIGPGLGETTVHFPLYVAEAGLVEIAALLTSPERAYRFGAASGLLVGTVGLVAEWGWSHVWMPIPWPSSLLGEALVAAPIAGLAGGVLGAFIGTALAAPRRRQPVAAPALAPAVLALAAVAGLIGYGLSTHTDSAVRATVALTDVRPAPHREVMATVRLQPGDAARNAKWLNVTAWQGGGLVVDRLNRIGPATYRTTKPIPVHGGWKSLVRLHRGDSLAGIPIYLPEDRAIPAAAVPAPARFERAFVAERGILQRERKDDVPMALPTLGYGTLLAIALSLIGLLGWALARLAHGAGAAAPTGKPRAPRARVREAAA